MKTRTKTDFSKTLAFFAIAALLVASIAYAQIREDDLIVIRAPAESKGMVGQDFKTLFEASGGVPPYRWLVSGGQLPPGLQLKPVDIQCIRAPCYSSSAEITGVPTQPGKYEFELLVEGQNQTSGRGIFLIIISERSSELKLIEPNGGEIWRRGAVEKIAWGPAGPGTVNIYLISFGFDERAYGGCPEDLKVCPDGTTVSRIGPVCDFAPCPLYPLPSDPIACTQEAKICPDGTAVGRTGPNCEFAPCPVYKKFTIASGIENDGVFEWNVGQTLEKILLPTGLYKIRIESGAGYDESDSAFTILMQDGIVVSTWSDLSGTTGSPFLASFEASGGMPPYEWSIGAGTLPPGLQLARTAFEECTTEPCPLYPIPQSNAYPQNSIIAIRGIPTKDGAYKFELVAQDSNGKQGKETFVITVSASTDSGFRVISPSGGEVWRRGGTEKIIWSRDSSGPCTDSDGGANYYVRGKTSGLEALEVVSTFVDYCGSAGDEAGKLVEYVCTDDGYVKKVLYSCPASCPENYPCNVTCSDGACIRAKEGPTITPSSPAPEEQPVVTSGSGSAGSGSLVHDLPYSFVRIQLIGDIYEVPVANPGVPAESKEVVIGYDRPVSDVRQVYTISESTENDGIFEWRVGEVVERVIIPNGKYVVRVCEVSGYSENCAESDPFLITPVNKPRTPVCRSGAQTSPKADPSETALERRSIEGWYLGDELVKAEDCMCDAVCRTDADVEGYYSSCTGELITQTRCSIVQEGETAPGAAGIAVVSSEQAVQRALETGYVDSVNDVEAVDENGRTLYKVTGSKKEFFLFIFPYNAEKTLAIDAQTGASVPAP